MYFRDRNFQLLDIGQADEFWDFSENSENVAILIPREEAIRFEWLGV
jgi:hypothetical protein